MEKFRRHRRDVENEAQVSHMIEAAEHRALELRDRELLEIDRKGTIGLALASDTFLWCTVQFKLVSEGGLSGGYLNC